MAIRQRATLYAADGDNVLKAWLKRSLKAAHELPPLETMPEDMRRLVELFPLNSAGQKRP